MKKLFFSLQLLLVFLLLIISYPVFAQVDYLEGDFDYNEVPGSTIHAADIENDLFFGFFPAGIPVSDYAPDWMPNPDTVHRVLFSQYVPGEGGLFNMIHYIRPTDVGLYDSVYNYTVREVKRIVEFDPFEFDTVTTGYIMVGDYTCDDCAKPQYGFLIKTDAFGTLQWTRRYDVPGVNDYLSLNSVEPIDDNALLSGFVICGYRWDQTNNRKVARVITTDLNGISGLTAELKENVSKGSEYKKVIHFENNDTYALVGTCNISSGLILIDTPIVIGSGGLPPYPLPPTWIQVLSNSDILLSTFFTSTADLFSRCYTITGSNIRESGVAITKTSDDDLGIIAWRKKSGGAGATERVLYLDVDIGNAALVATWSVNAFGQYNLGSSLNETPKDLVFDAVNGSVWASGNMDNSAFLLNIDPLTASLLISPADRFNAVTVPPVISANAIVMAQTSGNPVFYGETGTSNWGTLVERLSTTTVNFNCVTVAEQVTETFPGITSKVVRQNFPTPVCFPDTLIEFYDDLAQQYLCMDTMTGGGGGPPCSRLSNVVEVMSAGSLHDLQLYPNPADGLVIVHFFIESGGKVRLAIRNNIGQLMDSDQDWIFESGGHYDLPLTISTLPSGIYSLTVAHNQNRQTILLVVQH